MNVKNTFIVVATFRDGVDMAEVASLVPSEIVKVEQLRTEGRMGAVHISLTRGTVFIEALADDEAEAAAIVHSLPLGKFFELDVFATTPPLAPGQPS